MQNVLTPKFIFPRLNAFLLASALAVCLCLGGSGHSYAVSDQENNQGPEGSWLGHVTVFTQPQMSFQALDTYDAGGGMLQSNQASFRPQMPVSAGHGAWEMTGYNNFAVKFLAFFFDQSGTPMGTFVVQETATLSRNGQTYTGTGTIKEFDLGGKLITSADFTTHTMRISVTSN